MDERQTDERLRRMRDSDGRETDGRETQTDERQTDERLRRELHCQAPSNHRHWLAGRVEEMLAEPTPATPED